MNGKIITQGYAILANSEFRSNSHCVKSVRIRSYSCQYFPAFGLYMGRDTAYLSVFSPNAENTDQNNSEYWHFLRNVGKFTKFYTRKIF